MQISSLIKTLCIGAALTSSSVFASTVWFENTGFNGGHYDSGEFKAHTSDNGTFNTFCLEEAVGLSFNTLYNYTIDGNLVKNQNDRISKGTAWLYASFLDGTLLDADGVGGYLDHHSDNAYLVQKAMWALEGEITLVQLGANNYYTWALAHGGVADYTGSRIQVLNPTIISNHHDVQSVLVSVPDSGMTAMLLGLGLVGIALVRRKR